MIITPYYPGDILNLGIILGHTLGNVKRCHHTPRYRTGVPCADFPQHANKNETSLLWILLLPVAQWLRHMYQTPNEVSPYNKGAKQSSYSLVVTIFLFCFNFLNFP